MCEFSASTSGLGINIQCSTFSCKSEHLWTAVISILGINTLSFFIPLRWKFVTSAPRKGLAPADKTRQSVHIIQISTYFVSLTIKRRDRNHCTQWWICSAAAHSPLFITDTWIKRKPSPSHFHWEMMSCEIKASFGGYVNSHGRSRIWFSSRRSSIM